MLRPLVENISDISSEVKFIDLITDYKSFGFFFSLCFLILDIFLYMTFPEILFKSNFSNHLIKQKIEQNLYI